MKKCKYCQSEIDEKAVVCPICKRDLRNGNNPLLLIPIIILIIVFIVIPIYFVLSPNAPLKVREAVCQLGIRSDKRYCSYFIWEK